MKQWMHRQLDRVVALGISMVLMFLFVWESVLEHNHDSHHCHDHYCHKCAQISAVKSVIHYISLYQISLIAASLAIAEYVPCISDPKKKEKPVSLVSLKVRMDH